MNAPATSPPDTARPDAAPPDAAPADRAVRHPGPLPGWMPTSPCGDPCLPDDLAPGGRGLVARLALLLVLAAATVAAAPMLPLLPARARSSWLRRTARAVLATAQVRVEIVGARSFGVGGVLVVANHVSWVEVLALLSVQPVALVAKREVRAWPVVGTLAQDCGALFVDRARLRALPAAVAGVAGALRDGRAVVAFPEGTTWCGAAAGPFRRAVFQAAVDARTPVRPVAVTLCTPAGRPTSAACFVGEQELLPCLYRVVRAGGLVCRLTVLPMIHADGDRAGLARRAGDAIGAVTGVAHPAARPAVGSRG